MRIGSPAALTVDGQISYRDLIMGRSTVYRRVSVTGWRSLPGISSGNAAKPSSHGSWPGPKYAQERVITLTGRVQAPKIGYADVMDALEAATVPPTDDSEYPIVVREAEQSLVAWGVCTQRDIVMDRYYSVGMAPYALQFVCSDPRKYSVATQSVSMFSSPGSGGLVFPLVFPLNFGTPASPGSAIAINGGSADTPPTITITGPAENPEVVNNTTSKRIGFDVTLAAGDTLTIDVYLGTALLGAADRSGSLSDGTGPIADFELAPGANDLAFFTTTSSDTTKATVTWANARM